MVVRARIRLCRPGDPVRRSPDDRSRPAGARLPRRADHQRVLDLAARVAPVRRRDLRAAGNPIGDAMSASPIPKTAPFADDEIDILNRVVGPATAVQRAWLAGFLAGLDASSRAAARAQPPAAPQRPDPLTILYATESGNSEKLAGDVAKSARKLGFKPSLVDMADLELASLAKVKKLIVIAATWGEGEPPARAIHAYKELMSDAAPRRDGVGFGGPGRGHTAYVEFCAIGKAIDERLAALGGKRVADRVDCDLDFSEPAAKWIGATLK